MKISRLHSISKETNLMRQSIKNRVNTLEGNLQPRTSGAINFEIRVSTIEHHSFTPSFFLKGTFLFPEVPPQGDTTQTRSGSLSELRKVL